MNKKEFKNFVIKYCNYKTDIELKFLNNVLDYAEGMEEIEQYNFLCAILPNIPENDIKDVYY